jgi:hypothetical protein
LRRHPEVVLAATSTMVVLVAAPAAAMDLTPGALYLDPGGLPPGVNCQQVAQNPEQVLHPPFPAGAKPGSYSCLPNTVAWSNVMSELGMAIAPAALHGAKTTGIAGFVLDLEATFTGINTDSLDKTGTQYWHRATQNGKPDSVLQVYTFSARKGLPYGFEIVGVFGYLASTSLLIEGGDVRWAPLEGFRTGTLGQVPDFAIGGGVRTTTGASTFSLTTIGIDGEVSKPITVADSAVVTPYVGAQRVIILAASSAVDLTPGVDALQQCGWQGPNVPANPNGHAPYDGSPVCANKLSNGAPNNADFSNNRTFQRAQIHRWRGVVGAHYRYEILSLAGQFAMDLTDPSAENANLGVSGDRQWSVSLAAGVAF